MIDILKISYDYDRDISVTLSTDTGYEENNLPYNPFGDAPSIPIKEKKRKASHTDMQLLLIPMHSASPTTTTPSIL